MAEADIGVEWRLIPEFPDYEISPAGQVRRSLTSPVKGRGHPGDLLAQMTTAKTGAHVRLYANRAFKDIHVRALLQAIFPELHPPEPEDRQEWRSIREAPEYDISDQGKVRRGVRGRSSRALKGILLRQHPDRNEEYAVVILFVRNDDGTLTKIKRPVHQLVLEAFHGPRPAGFVGRHLDGNAFNNSASNLAWGTVRENVHDKYAHGTMAHGEKVYCAKLTADVVREIRAHGEWRRGEKTAFARMHGVSRTAVNQIIRGKSWRHVN